MNQEQEAIDSLAGVIRARMAGDEDESPLVAMIEGAGDMVIPDEPYEFDDGFQEKIVALLLRDVVFARRVVGLVKPNYFETNVLSALTDIALRFYDKYKRVPSDLSTLAELIKDGIAKKQIDKALVPEIKSFIKRVYVADLSDRDYVSDKVGEFAHQQAVKQATIHAINLFERGDFAKAEEVLSKSFKVGVHKEGKSVNFLADINRRTEYRVDLGLGKIRPNGITTGHRRLDQLLFHKGWGRAELSVIMGGAKRGKSTALIGFAKNAVAAGHNVLFVTLEVSAEITSYRLDANISDVEMDDLIDKAITVEVAVNNFAKTVKGKFFIEEFPSGAFSPNDMQALIERYRAEGIIFDLVIVDYLDIMRPNKHMDNDISNSKSVWVDMRGVAQQEGFALLSATQTNREGHKSAVAKDTDVAEDFNKIRIADLTLSINSTDEERKKGEARLYFASSRNQAGNLTVHIKQALNKMQFITDVVGVE